MRRWLQPVLFRSRGLATLLVLPRLARAKRWGVSLLGAAGAVAYPEVAPDDEEVWVVATALAASRLEATPKTPTAGIAAGDCRRGRWPDGRPVLNEGHASRLGQPVTSRGHS